MIRWKNMLIGTFMFIIGSMAFSKNVVFSCMQNLDAYEDSYKATFKFEEMLFECFFDNGLIASNLPVSRVNKSEFDNLEFAKEHIESPSDYVLFLYLQYAKEPIFDTRNNIKIPDLNKVSWKLVDYTTGKTLNKRSFTMKKIKTQNGLYQNLSGIADDISDMMIGKID